MAYNPDLDQIAVSVWAFSEFWIIDHGTTTAQAAGHTGGRRGRGGDLLYRWGNPRAYRAGTKADRKLFSQHNAHWIPKGLPGAGHLLLFNNGRERPDGSYSSVDELVLPADSQGRYTRQPGKAYGPDQPVWSYTAPEEAGLLFVLHFRRPAAVERQHAHLLGRQRHHLRSDAGKGDRLEVRQSRQGRVRRSARRRGRGRSCRPSRGKCWRSPPTSGSSSTRSRKTSTPTWTSSSRPIKRSKPRNGRETRAAMGSILRPQPGQVMAGPEQNRLKLTDDQKKDVLALQKAIDGRFDRVLTAAQKNQIKSVFAPLGPPPGGPGPGDPPQPGKIFSPAQQDTLKLSAAQKTRLEEIQKEIDAQARDVAHRGPEKAAPGDAADAPAAADRAAAVPRADVRSSAPFVMQPASPDSRART